MPRYIDIENRKEFVDTLYALRSECHFKHRQGCLAPDCRTCLDRSFDFLSHLLPKVDVVPVIHAEWAYVADVFWHCSNCRYTITGSDKGYKYCPNCGAKMDGDKHA